MNRTVKLALITGALALSASPALSLAKPAGHGHSPGASLPAKAKAYGKYCQNESKKHVDGREGNALQPMRYRDGQARQRRGRQSPQGLPEREQEACRRSRRERPSANASRLGRSCSTPSITPRDRRARSCPIDMIMPRFLVQVYCSPDAVAAVVGSGLNSGSPVSRDGFGPSLSVVVPFFLSGETKEAVKSRVDDALSPVGVVYSVDEPRYDIADSDIDDSMKRLTDEDLGACIKTTQAYIEPRRAHPDASIEADEYQLAKLEHLRDWRRYSEI